MLGERTSLLATGPWLLSSQPWLPLLVVKPRDTPCPHAARRFGSLYGELARFILRLLGFKTGKRKGVKGSDGAGESAPSPQLGGPPPTGPPAVQMAGGDNWNSLWSSKNNSS